MIKKHRFAHSFADGKTSGKRLKELGYDWRAMGENIVWGFDSYSKSKGCFEAWIKSEGYKQNLLDKTFEQVGVGALKVNSRKAARSRPSTRWTSEVSRSRSRK